MNTCGCSGSRSDSLRKLDGERCLAFADAGGVRLMSRDRHEITTTFPELAEALAARRHGDLRTRRSS